MSDVTKDAGDKDTYALKSAKLDPAPTIAGRQ